jgi:hypothetical protein
VDRDATMEEAPTLGARVLDRLVERGIVLPVPSDCVLGSPLGYPPGPNYIAAVVEESSYLHRMMVNGLHIITEHTVFDAGQYGLNFICNACDVQFAYQDLEPYWTDAVNEWYDNRGVGLLTCPRCDYTEPVTEWGFDPPWGFGNLGFEFWGWPELSEDFVEAVSAWLSHRTVVVYGKV